MNSMLFSKAAAITAGILSIHLYSGWFPASQAAWAWECGYYEGGSITGVKYMAPNAAGGPKCADGSTLTCSCTADPCENRNEALPSNLICAGAGDDASTSGCYKLHHTYGTPPGFRVWAGRNADTDTVTDACGEAEVIKVYTTEKAAGIFEMRNGFTKDQMDTSESFASAQACQAKCASTPDCKFFTFNDQGPPDGKYKEFRACVLHKALACDGAKFSLFNGAIAGPSACPDGVTVPSAGAPAPAPEPAPAPGPASAPATTTPAGGNTADHSPHSQQFSLTLASVVLLALAFGV